ncbi:MAG: dihydroneopterin aldolase [Saprospiraceae bacterium]|nr:dihydroneopterin aldolase [Saprospiraceae bacterium]
METVNRQFVGIQGLRIHGYHGVYPEEALTGHWFRIDLQVEVPVLSDPASDDLDHTLNYETLHRICLVEMAIRADLLETVATRIIRQIRSQHPRSGEVRIRLTKEHPTFKGGCAAVFVEYISLP